MVKKQNSRILPGMGTVMVSAVSWASRSGVYHGVLISTIISIFSLLVLKPRNVNQYDIYVTVKGSALSCSHFQVGQVDSICTEQGVVLLESSRNPRNPEKKSLTSPESTSGRCQRSCNSFCSHC